MIWCGMNSNALVVAASRTLQGDPSRGDPRNPPTNDNTDPVWGVRCAVCGVGRHDAMVFARLLPLSATSRVERVVLTAGKEGPTHGGLL